MMIYVLFSVFFLTSVLVRFSLVRQNAAIQVDVMLDPVNNFFFSNCFSP